MEFSRCPFRDISINSANAYAACKTEQRLTTTLSETLTSMAWRITRRLKLETAPLVDKNDLYQIDLFGIYIPYFFFCTVVSWV